MTKTKHDKIVFLDMDGVMNSYESVKEHMKDGTYGVMEDIPSEPMISNLNKILKETGAKIVISSSWRYFMNKMAMQYILFLSGVVPADVVIGETPKKMSANRGHEISLWFEDNEVNSYVILDDNDDMGEHKHRLVQTDMQVGLTEEDANRAIQVLNQKC